MEGLTAEEAQVYDRQVRGGAPPAEEGPGRGPPLPAAGGKASGVGGAPTDAVAAAAEKSFRRLGPARRSGCGGR